jgi:hypothetical protein
MPLSFIEINYTQNDIKIFEKYLNKKISNCWLFTGPTNDHGYDRFYAQGSRYQAHRFAYNIYCGSIPIGELVLHKCDNRLCCNPQHLYLGDQFDNMQDRLNHGDYYVGYQKGEKFNRTKLTNENIKQIRYLCNVGISQKKIAKNF